MPITPLHPVRRISQGEFQELSYAVMRHVFEIHNEFGRFFDERIYKRELACRFPGVELEFPVAISHGSFSTTLYLDALIGNAGAFEFKTSDVLTPRHRGQLYNYLLLLDLAHGKLVNMRPELVEHEFVNALVCAEERQVFQVDTNRWSKSVSGAEPVRDFMVELLHDWGTGLRLELYESALMHILGGEEQVVREVNARGDGHELGTQRMRLAADDVAFRITAFEEEDNLFEDHARRLLRHVDLRAILWVNVALQRVTFTSIERSGL